MLPRSPAGGAGADLWGGGPGSVPAPTSLPLPRTSPPAPGLPPQRLRLPSRGAAKHSWGLSCPSLLWGVIILVWGLPPAAKPSREEPASGGKPGPRTGSAAQLLCDVELVTETLCLSFLNCGMSACRSDLAHSL